MTLKVASVPAGTVTAPERPVSGNTDQPRRPARALKSKRLDQGRTRLAVVAGVAGAAALAATILRGRSTGESAVTEPPANFTLSLAFPGRQARTGDRVGLRGGGPPEAALTSEGKWAPSGTHAS